MGPFQPEEDDDLKASLLEKLMGEMDDRIAKQSFPEKAATNPSEPKITEESSGDGLDEDPNIDPELRDLIRNKRGF